MPCFSSVACALTFEFRSVKLIRFLGSSQEKCLSQSDEIKTLKDQLSTAQKSLQVTVCDFAQN